MTPRRALSGFLLTGIVTLVLATACSTTQRESVEQPEGNVDADTGSAFAGGSDATEKSPKPSDLQVSPARRRLASSRVAEAPFVAGRGKRQY